MEFLIFFLKKKLRVSKLAKSWGIIYILMMWKNQVLYYILVLDLILHLYYGTSPDEGTSIVWIAN